MNISPNNRPHAEVDLSALKDKISDAFDLNEIQDLCFDLGIKYSEIPNPDGTLTGAARELVAFMERRNQLNMLIQACQDARPAVGWPQLQNDPTSLEPQTINDTGDVVIEPAEADPRFIPDTGYSIIGREKDLAILKNSFNVNKLVVLEGLAGIGKTSLASEFALESLGIYKKILWHSVESGDSIKTIFVALAAQFDELGDPRFLQAERNPQLTVRDRINTLINLLDESKILLVLDSFENIVEDHSYFIKQEFTYFIRQLFTRSYRSHVLFISKIKIKFNPEYFSNFSTCELQGLQLDDAITLFTSLCRRVKHPISQQEAALVCRETGGHPFALTIIIGLLRHGYPLHRLLDQMRQRVTTDYGHYLLDIIYSRLSKAGKRLLGATSVHRRLVPLRALEQLPADTTRLEELLPYFLIQLEPESRRYFMHAIVREYAYQKLSRHEERKQKAHKLAGDYYASLTKRSKGFHNQHDVNTVQHVLEAQYHYREANYLHGTIEMSVYVVDELKPLVKELDKAGEDELAQKLYKSILAVDNRDAYIHYNYARFLSRSDGDSAQIEHHYQQAAMLRPDKSWMQREYIFWLIHHNKFEEAYSWFWTIIPQGDHDYHLYLSYVNVLIANKRYEEATAVLEKALEVLPNLNSHKFYQQYSRVLRETDQHEAAVTLLQSALDVVLEQGLKEIYIEYSQVLREMGQLEAALDLLKAGQKAVPPEQGLRDIYIESGKVLRTLGRYDEAIKSLDFALKVVPAQGAGQLYVQYSQILRETNQRETAVTILESALHVVPEQGLGQIYVQYSQVLRELDRKEDAAELLKSALEVVPEQSIGQIYVHYSQVLRELDRKEEAAELLKSALDVVPEQGLADIYVESSQVLRELQQHDVAIELMESALKTVPEQALGQLYMQYSQVLRDINEHETAVSLLNGALEIVPEQGLRDIYVEFSQVLREINQREMAVELLDKALQEVPDQGVGQIYVQYSQVLREMGQHETAVGLLKSALDIVPELGLRDIYVEYGQLLYEMKEQGTKDAFLDAFLANVPPNHQQIAQRYEEQGLLKSNQADAE